MPTLGACPNCEAPEPVWPASPLSPFGVWTTPPTVAAPFFTVFVVLEVFAGVFTGAIVVVVDVEAGGVLRANPVLGALIVVFEVFFAAFLRLAPTAETNVVDPCPGALRMLDFGIVVVFLSWLSELDALVAGAGESDRNSGTNAR